MTPKMLIQKFIDYFNNGDANSLADLYLENAVNYQVPNEPVKGRENIRKMFSREFSSAKMHCIVENIFEDGEWGILEWKDPLGLRGCGFFQIQNGRIKLQRGYWDKLTFMKIHGIKNNFKEQ